MRVANGMEGVCARRGRLFEFARENFTRPRRGRGDIMRVDVVHHRFERIDDVGAPWRVSREHVDQTAQDLGIGDEVAHLQVSQSYLNGAQLVDRLGTCCCFVSYRGGFEGKQATYVRV